MASALQRTYSELLTPLELGDRDPQSWMHFGKIQKIQYHLYRNSMKILEKLSPIFNNSFIVSKHPENTSNGHNKYQGQN